MAILYKNLSAYPNGAELTLLYMPPTGKQAVISSLTVCNQNPKNATFRIAVKPASDSVSSQHYRYYDALVRGNRSFVATLGISLTSQDQLYVYSSNGLLSFSVDYAEMDT